MLKKIKVYLHLGKSILKRKLKKTNHHENNFQEKMKEVTDTTVFSVLHFKPNDSRPYVDRFYSHDEAYAFALEILPECERCVIKTERTQREVLK